MIWAWILGILAAIAAVPVIIYLIGALLPPEFRAEVTALIGAPRERVFKDILDIRRFPVSGTMMKARGDLPPQDGKPAWKEHIGMSEVHAVVSEQTAPERIVFDLRDSVVPMTSRWTFTLEPADGGTKVTVEQAGRIDKGSFHSPVFRFIMRLTGGARTGPRDYLKRIAAAYPKVA